MFNELVDEVVKVDVESLLSYKFPLDKTYGLEVTYENRIYKFILKFSKNNKMNLFFYDGENLIRIKLSDFLNQNIEIDKLNEILIQKNEELSHSNSSNQFKVNTLSSMIIGKDNALSSLSAKIDELQKINVNKDNHIEQIKKNLEDQEELNNKIKQLEKQKIELSNQNSELSNSVLDRDSQIQMLKNDIGEMNLKIESNLKHFNAEIGEKDVLIRDLNEVKSGLEEKLDESSRVNEALSEEIDFLKFIIDKNYSSMNSLSERIEVLNKLFYKGK